MRTKSKIAVCLIAASLLYAAPAPAPNAAQVSASTALPDAQQLLAFVSETISWYGRLDVETQLADQPTDVLYVNDDRAIGRQVLTLSFDFARADAQLLTDEGKSTLLASAATSSARYQRLGQSAATAADQLRRAQEELAALQVRLANATGADRQTVQALIAEAESKVELAKARNETLGGIVAFINASSGAGGGDLVSQIAALEQTVPTATGTSAGTVAPPPRKSAPNGIIGLITDLVWLNQKEQGLSQSIRATEVLSQGSRRFTAPLVASLTQATRRGDELSSEPESNDPAVITQRKAELDALQLRFRQVSAAMLPLAKRRILLETHKTNLTRWRAAVIDLYRVELRRLLFRGGALAITLLLVFVMSALWRRVTFRYVHDVRRRHQFLLLRRIVMLIVVASILAISFATDVGSLTTFAGFLTAGIAIALQDVILSVAGYFVIIGKYGIRVGDRVQIAHVAGEVIEIGLVRLYLMELEPRGGDQLPTGRIVEFPNAVVFDASAGIFKQLPGTHFLWHEVSVIVPTGADHQATRARMLEAVDTVFADYREAVERQHREMERMLRLTMEPPHPQSRLRIASGGVEVTIRYPVELQNAAEIDDRVASAVTAAIGQPPGETASTTLQPT